MDMPKPTELHHRLHRLAGRWAGEETLYASPWDPVGGPALAEIRNRPALGGFVLIQDYAQTRGGETTFLGHGVFWIDPASDEVVLHWFDNMGFPPNEFRGRFEGERLSLCCQQGQGRQRVSFDLSEPGRYRFRMEVSGDGTRWAPFMDGVYSRLGE